MILLYIPAVNDFAMYSYCEWACYIFLPWMSMLYILTVNKIVIHLYREWFCYILLSWMSLLYITIVNDLLCIPAVNDFVMYSYREWVCYILLPWMSLLYILTVIVLPDSVTTRFWSSHNRCTIYLLYLGTPLYFVLQKFATNILFPLLTASPQLHKAAPLQFVK
jgi:hypothetical protein